MKDVASERARCCEMKPIAVWGLALGAALLISMIPTL